MANVDPLLRQEAEELTNGMRAEPAFAHVRRIVEAAGLDPERVAIGGLVEGEQNDGILLAVETRERLHVIDFEKDVPTSKAVIGFDEAVERFPAAVAAVELV